MSGASSTNTFLTPDLGRVLRLEGCLSGNVPDNEEGLGQLPPVCREIAELKPARVVFGPATFINTSVNELTDEFTRRQQANLQQAQQAADAARKLSKRRGDPPSEQRRLAGAAYNAVHGPVRPAGRGPRPSLRNQRAAHASTDPQFVETLVFGTTQGTPEDPLRVPLPLAATPR